MSASARTEAIGRPATQLSRTLARIHHEQGSPGLNPRELLLAIDRLITERLWEDEVGWDGRPMTLARALAEPWPIGVGMTPQRLERLYALAGDAGVDPALVQRVRETVDGLPLGRQGSHSSGNTNAAASSGGTSRSYIRNRLRRDRPDLYERVTSGEMSAAAAAVEAGWRPRRHSIRIDSSDEAIKGLLRHFTADQLRAALDELEEPPTP